MLDALFLFSWRCAALHCIVLLFFPWCRLLLCGHTDRRQSIILENQRLVQERLQKAKEYADILRKCTTRREDGSASTSSTCTFGTVQYGTGTQPPTFSSLCAPGETPGQTVLEVEAMENEAAMVRLMSFLVFKFLSTRTAGDTFLEEAEEIFIAHVQTTLRNKC